MKRLANGLLSIFFLSSMSLLPINAIYAAASSTNLIANPGLETDTSGNTSQPLDWLQGNWGTNTVTFSYNASDAHSGNYGVGVNMTSYSSGDAKWYFNPVNITGGNTYSFNDYYEASVPTDVVIQYSTNAGSLSYVDLGTQAASPSAWAMVNDTFTTPTSATQMTIFHLISSVGWLNTDDFSLTTSVPVPTISITSPVANSNLVGNVTLSASTTNTSSIASVQYTLDGSVIGSPVTASPFNLTWNTAQTTNGTHQFGAVATTSTSTTVNATPVTVNVSNPTTTGNMIPDPENLIVDSSNSSVPQDWTTDNWGTNKVTFGYLTNGSGYNGSNALTVNMTSYTSGDGKWSFNPQNVTADTQYKYSEYYESNVQTEVDAVFNMTDGSTIYQIIGLPGPATTWTNFTTEFVIPSGTANVTIYHFIEKVGQLSTSDFSMTTYNPVGFTRPLVSLTFDDGYVNEYTQALPLLKADGFASTQFIITDLIGTKGYMTKAEIQTMSKDGHEIASHTVTHDDMTQETASQLLTELSTSQSALKTLTGTTVYDLAYPYGLYNSTVLAQVPAYYQAARGVEDGLNSKDNFNAYDLKVQNVFNTTTTAQVADWVKQAQMTDTWLILVYHSVDPNVNSPIDGDIYNVTPTQLSAQLAAVKSSGITVETMHQAVVETEAQL